MSMDRLPYRGLLAVALALVLVGASLAPADLKPTPPPTGPGLPTPPQQNQPWTPPATGLPRFLAVATASLFEQGLADPRGCEYREVELEGEGTGGFTPDGNPRPTTHAWVLPAQAEGSPRFAVAWNGLIYPLAKLGDPVDLDADVPPLPNGGDDEGPRGRRGSGYRYYRATGHLQSAERDGREPLRAGLLLRLGRADLAERAFAASTGWKPPGSPRDLTSYGVSYLTLAADWAWALFDRASAAHARADDRQALADARELSRIRPLIEGKARALGFPEQPPNAQAGYLPFLKPLPELLGDQEGRARRGPRTVRDVAGALAIADPPGRIAALIDLLDEARGGDRMVFRPEPEETVLRAIIREGKAAVDPLLKVIESDDRLTREVQGDDRRGTRVRSFTPVYQQANSALTTILGTGQFSNNPVTLYDADRAKRREYAATARAYVDRFRDVAPEEQWFQILGDDRANPRQWGEVVGKIVAPVVPVQSKHRRENLPYRTPRVAYGEEVARAGDPLRGKKSPSVSELIARRVEALSRPDADFGGMSQAGKLALDLAPWDPEAARPVMAEVARRCLDRISGKVREKYGQQKASEAAVLAQLVDARAQLGDPGGLADYAAMLALVDPREFSHSIESILQPMEDHCDDPAIARISERLFLDPASPWLPLLGDEKHPNAWTRSNTVLGGPMLGVAAFRAALVKALGDRSPIGSARLEAGGSLRYQLRNGNSGGSSPVLVAPDEPKETGDVPIRACDFLGWELSGVIDGLPPLMPFWPEARRDRALADQVSFLERFGARYARSPLRDAIPPSRISRRREPTFPPLDHPATLDDVRRGLAIFSLEGQGPTRVVPLPTRPIETTWVTLKDYPSPQRTTDGTGKTTIETAYDQGGLVWQAEEVEEGGRWRRYYGFAGRRLDKVPAEEVEFAEGWYRPSLMSDKVDAWLVADRAQPGIFTLRFRNRGGLPRSVPTTFLRADPPALGPGVDLALLYTPLARAQLMNGGFGGPGVAWETVNPRSTARFDPGPATRALEPAESFDAGTLRPGDWFDLSRAGTYRLQVRFGAGSGVGEGTSNEQVFPMPEPPRADR